MEMIFPPQFKRGISLRPFVGGGSSESFQMQFKGDGFVVIQTYEEINMGQARRGSVGVIKLSEQS